jgi:hypothetical protein
MVIIDYLEKGLIFILLLDIRIEIVVRAFIKYVVVYY